VRILHVVPTYLPATRYGGPIYAVHGLCRTLVLRGHDVSVYTTNVDGPDDSDVPLATPVDRDGVKVRYFPTARTAVARRLYFSPRMGAALRQNVRDFDLIHLHSVFLWPTFAAARQASAARVPYLISPRGMLVPELIRRKSRLTKLAWIQLVERRTFRQAAGVHFTSLIEQQEAAATGLPLPRSFVVPNGIELPSLLSSRRDPHTLLFLGRINWKKGIDRLIDALPRVPDAELIIAGNDEEGLTPKLMAQAARSGVASRVDFRGPVSGAEKENLLRSCTAMVLPSYSENFGNSVVEAMAAGMPVILTPEVGLAPDVAAFGAGVVTSGDPDQLAAAIDQILGDPHRRTAMGLRGRALAEQRFTWGRVAAEMEEAYRCSIESRP
jgi:glycosyltransferase involved in cell wall biosynthesis